MTKAGSDVVGAPVYLFTLAGSYLGRSENTDASGVAQFMLPGQQYKFRVDHEGSQYWSDVVTIISYEENTIELNLDLLALDLTNDPNPVRFDGVPPKPEPEKAVVALLGSLPGFLVDSAYAQAGGEKTYFFINDHLGTPQKVVDETGAVVWSADYRPFGEANVTVNTAENNFRFPGQYFDGETGLHYNWHRYYEPGIGRYVGPDKIRHSHRQVLKNISLVRGIQISSEPSSIDVRSFLSGSFFLELYLHPHPVHLYPYARNNPVKFVDLTGEFAWIPAIVIGGLIAGDAVVDWIGSHQEHVRVDPQTEIFVITETHTITPILPVRLDFIINTSSDGTTSGQVFVTISGYTFDVSKNLLETKTRLAKTPCK